MTIAYVILPQATRNVLPDLTSNTLEVIKFTALASVVALPELLRQARARGLAASNGLGMLVAQAEIAFERWTGVAASGPIMRAALEADPGSDHLGA